MMPCRSLIVTVPVRTTGGPAKSLLAGTSVQVPFRALWSRAKAANPKRRVVKTAPVIAVVEYVLNDFLPGAKFLTESYLSAGNVRARAVPLIERLRIRIRAFHNPWNPRAEFRNRVLNLLPPALPPAGEPAARAAEKTVDAEGDSGTPEIR